MPSPFPGMNPYLERADLWNDFHNTFITLSRELLVAQVLPRYYVRIEEHLYIHEPSAQERYPLGRPDISVQPNPFPTPGTNNGGTAVVAPASVGMPIVVEERLPYLEIRDRYRNEVVTIFELLSPSNKSTGSNREQYLAKVQRILASNTNFVEIDLLRSGPRMPWDRLQPCDYYAIVSRRQNRTGNDPAADLWPIALRDPLPTISIPLRPGETEPTLDLQAMIHRVYDSAGYQVFIYNSDPEPPLSPADAVWATQLLQPVA